MAKKDGSKKQAIEKALKGKDKSPSVIAAKLQAEGIDVNANYVSMVKHGMKKVGAKRKPAADDKVSLSALVSAKKLADRLSGIEKVKAAVNALARIGSR